MPYLVGDYQLVTTNRVPSRNQFFAVSLPQISERAGSEVWGFFVCSHVVVGESENSPALFDKADTFFLIIKYRVGRIANPSEHLTEQHLVESFIFLSRIREFENFSKLLILCFCLNE